MTEEATSQAQPTADDAASIAAIEAAITAADKPAAAPEPQPTEAQDPQTPADKPEEAAAEDSGEQTPAEKPDATPEAADVDAKVAAAVKRIAGIEYDDLKAKLGDEQAATVARKLAGIRTAFDRETGRNGHLTAEVNRLKAEVEALRALKDQPTSDPATADDLKFSPDDLDDADAFTAKLNKAIEHRAKAIADAQKPAEQPTGPDPKTVAEIDGFFASLDQSLFGQYGNAPIGDFAPNDPEVFARNELLAEAQEIANRLAARGTPIGQVDALKRALLVVHPTEYQKSLEKQQRQQTERARRGSSVPPSTRQQLPKTPPTPDEQSIDAIEQMILAAGG